MPRSLSLCSTRLSFGLVTFWLCQDGVYHCQVVVWPCQVVFWLCQDSVYRKTLETPP